MNDVVQPVSVNPLVWQDNVRFSKLVVDIVQGQDTLHHVMYIGTGEQTSRPGKLSQSVVTNIEITLLYSNPVDLKCT